VWRVDEESEKDAKSSLLWVLCVCSALWRERRLVGLVSSHYE
jgi:hypothetical protein